MATETRFQVNLPYPISWPPTQKGEASKKSPLARLSILDGPAKKSTFESANIIRNLFAVNLKSPARDSALYYY
jgi:hypothetical protein